MNNQRTSQAEQSEFEDAVRRVARSLWPEAAYQGAAIIDGRERDGVFETEDVLHLIECTTSRKKDKAQGDINKLVDLWKKLRNREKPVKCWFITQEEPTAEQRQVVDDIRKRKDTIGLTITALSIDQFRQRLIDIPKYIECRKKYRFGSMQEKPSETALKYVPFDIISNSGQSYSVDELVTKLLSGQRIVMLGDYGAGKSTTMRELFHKLSAPNVRKEHHQFPVLLNLRDHYGQTHAAEALERHARNIGFEPGSELTRAWRAGSALIMLDGFDEIAIPGWQGQAERMKKLRYDSMQLIRDFVNDNPDDRGIIISGRHNYFDGDAEMEGSLGLRRGGSSVHYLSLHDFSEEQVRQYLSSSGWSQQVPTWLPTRPLLLSYLMRNQLIGTVLETASEITPAQGWEQLLDRICERESQLEVGVDGPTIRLLIERLASGARRTSDGLGPIAAEDISNTFRDVCHYVPNDKASILLQRLPGLGLPNNEDGARKFIDVSLVDAARAGDVYRFIRDPHGNKIPMSDEWVAGLGELGTQMVLNCFRADGTKLTQVTVALREATERYKASVLASDLVRLAQELGCSYADRNQAEVTIRDVLIDELAFDNESPDLSRVRYKDCYIKSLQLAAEIEYEQMPRFEQCYFTAVDGRISEQEMPASVFAQCAFGTFSNSGETTNALLELPLPIGCRVMVVVLKKLYMQSGAGRQDSALRRGLDHKGRQHVEDVLRILEQSEMVMKSRIGQNTTWLPVRSKTARARHILAAPNTSQDPLMVAARALSE